MTSLVLMVLLAMTGVMLAAFAVQRRARNGGWTDVFWTFGTGATCALAAAAPIGADPGVAWRRWLVAAMVLLWSLRLGAYVAQRVAQGPEDVRYAELRREWGPHLNRNMFALLIVQAPITALVSVGVLTAARHEGGALRAFDVLGVVVYLAALLGEAVADRQMKAFKQDPANRGGVCERGLWAWSRHPNYFFEALIWCAYPVMGLDPGRPWSAAALAAPLVMFVIVRFGTGVPPLEKAMLATKGEAYRRYQARVGALVPRPPRGEAG